MEKLPAALVHLESILHRHLEQHRAWDVLQGNTITEVAGVLAVHALIAQTVSTILQVV